jgi:hypothetical protein
MSASPTFCAAARCAVRSAASSPVSSLSAANSCSACSRRVCSSEHVVARRFDRVALLLRSLDRVERGVDAPLDDALEEHPAQTAAVAGVGEHQAGPGNDRRGERQREEQCPFHRRSPFPDTPIRRYGVRPIDSPLRMAHPGKGGLFAK